MFEEELKYVHEYLINHNGDNSPRINETFRHRSKHVYNVYQWAIRIYNELDKLLQAKIDQNALYLACIFHDVGYGSEHFHNSHPIEGADIWKEYAVSKHFDTELIDYVYYLIRMHSNKELLQNKNTPLELIILMEADWLDEEGAMSICWDLITLGHDNPLSYEEALQKLQKYSAHILNTNPLVTAPGRKFWSQKQTLVSDFIKELKFDLFMWIITSFF